MKKLISKIRLLWEKISETGLRKELLLGDLETKFLNRFILCQTVLLILYVALRLILFDWQTVLIIVVYMFLSLLTLLLNYYQKQRAARIYQIVLMNVYIFFAVLQYGGAVNNEYFFLMVSLFGFFFFWRQKVLLFANLILSISLFYIALAYTSTDEAWLDLPHEAIQKTGNIVNFISFIVLWIIIYNLIDIWAEFQRKIINKNQIIEEKTRTIDSGLRYAEHLQLSLFPPIELVADYFADSFYYARPKDVLGGDFPFFYKDQSDDTVWLAAADCTGHGLSGALISVLGINLLHQALSEKSIKSPEKVLDWLSDELERSFNRFSKYDIRDGLDISIAKVKKENKEDFLIEWAGANNPLWAVPRSDTYLDCSSEAYNCMALGEDKLVELHGNKRPVGKFIRSESFIKRSLRLKKGDRLFMFSDGYTDQFGGERNKKFSKKRFRYLLASLKNESLSNFSDRLYEEIKMWSEGVEQVDDILVIGVEL